MRQTAEVTLTPFSLEGQHWELADDDEIVLFPEYLDGDMAVYRPAVIRFAKELAAEGVSVRYAFPPEKRTWLHEYSASDWAGQLLIGVAGGAPWFVLQQFLDRRKSRRLTVEITTARKVKGRRKWDVQTVRLTGSPDDVVEVATRLGLDKDTDG